MSLVFKTIHSPNILTSFCAFPAFLLAYQWRQMFAIQGGQSSPLIEWTHTTSEHRFVSSFLIRSVSLSWSKCLWISPQGFRCKHAVLLLLFKALNPVVYITGLLSGVDRQSVSAEISLSTYLPLSNVFGAFLEEEKPLIKVPSLKPVSSYGKHSQWRL